jgi:hypothetical protein
MNTFSEPTQPDSFRLKRLFKWGNRQVLVKVDFLLFTLKARYTRALNAKSCFYMKAIWLATFLRNMNPKNE